MIERTPDQLAWIDFCIRKKFMDARALLDDTRHFVSEVGMGDLTRHELNALIRDAKLLLEFGEEKEDGKAA